MSNGQILLRAHELVNGSRQREYGDPVESFGRVANLWAAYLRRPFTSAEVCLMLALLKIAREAHSHKQDNLIDACGYLSLAVDLSEDPRPPEEAAPEVIGDKERLSADKALSCALVSVDCGESARGLLALKASGFPEESAKKVIDGIQGLIGSKQGRSKKDF